ncbi:phage tail tape measure protein [Morganella morganii]|uniref:phage tail tape measure protein n=1 Tax=Morganella morganii TaxID=582 RepID=UPI0016447C4F|nr:phage tail tape measure protein [Morganella morganii]MBC3994440.1 phage tail tape measure protein [Morganella morganii]
MADIETLAAALHRNAASFKADMAEAYSSASADSLKFAQSAGADAAGTANKLALVSDEAKRTGNHLAQAGAGFSQFAIPLTTLLNSLNTGGSLTFSALIPALGQALNETGKLSAEIDNKRAKDIAAAESALRMAQAQVRQAESAKQAAQSQIRLAGNMRDEAVARREQALALDAYYAKKAALSKQDGTDVSYAKEHARNAAVIRRANIAETNAKLQIANASRSLADAERSEIAGKQNLATATTRVADENKKLSVSQRLTAQAGGLLKNTWGMLGGLPGVGLMLAADGISYLYSQYKQAEERQNAFTQAIQQGGAGISNSVYQLNALTNHLGGTAEAYKTVTTAAGAGFSGTMLRDISEFGVQLEKSGGSADYMISKLASINEQPLQSLRQLINEGLAFDENTINRIALLERQGDVEGAKELARQSALDATKKLHEEQTRINTVHEKGVKEIEDRYASLNQNARDFSVSTGIARIQAFNMEKLMWQIGSTIQNAELENQQKEQIKDTREQLDVQLKLNSAHQAGRDRNAEKLQLQNVAREQLKSGKMDAAQFEQTMKGLDTLYGSSVQKTLGSGGSVIPEGQRRTQQLMEQTAVLRAQLAENEKLTESENKLIAFDRELLDLSGKKNDAGKRSVQENAAAIRSVLETNAALEREIALKKLSKQYDEQNRDLKSRTATMQQEADNQRLQGTMSPISFELMQKEQEIAADFGRRRYELDKNVTDKTSDLYIAQTTLFNEEQEKQLSIVRQTAGEKALKEESWQEGLKQGWKDFTADSGTAFEMMRGVSARALSSTSALFSDFLLTGRAGFADFTRSILTDIAKMIIQMMIFNSIKGALGGTWLGNMLGIQPNAAGGVYSSAGLSSYSNSIVSSPVFFPVSNSGTPTVGLMGEAGDEAIMPLKRGPDGNLGVRAFGGRAAPPGIAGAAAPVVYITVSSEGSPQTQATGGYEQFGREVGQFVDQRYRSLVASDLRPGGAIWNVAKGGR